MGKYLTVVALFLITGCGGEGISSMNRAKQDFACIDHGGVYDYVPWFMQAKCLNGRTIDGWDRLTLPVGHMPKVDL